MTTVTTQAELDEALRAKARTIYIQSDSGVTLYVSDSGSSHVVAWDSSHVEARDSSHVVARDFSHVVAWDSSHVVARDSSHVVARDFSHVVARDSSHVEARDFSHVVAWDSSHVEAWGSSHVVAAKYTAVHLWSQRVTLDAQGALVDMTGIDLEDVQTFIDYHGVKVTDGRALVFKAVDDELNAGHSYKKTLYAIGSTVVAPDWVKNQSCGYGLHFSPSPTGAKGYFDQATRFLAVEVEVDGIVALGDKIKVESAKVLYEVDLFGTKVTQRTNLA